MTDSAHGNSTPPRTRPPVGTPTTHNRLGLRRLATSLVSSSSSSSEQLGDMEEEIAHLSYDYRRVLDRAGLADALPDFGRSPRSLRCTRHSAKAAMPAANALLRLPLLLRAAAILAPLSR